MKVKEVCFDVNELAEKLCIEDARRGRLETLEKREEEEKKMRYYESLMKKPPHHP